MTKESIENGEHLEPVFVARQPIFTPDMDIWGYELVIHRSQDGDSDASLAASLLVDQGLDFALEGIDKDHKLLVTVPIDFLESEFPAGVDKKRYIFSPAEPLSTDKQEALKKLKDTGLSVMLGEYALSGNGNSLAGYADIIKVKPTDHSPDEFKSIIDNNAGLKNKLLVDKVDTLKMFDLTKQLGVGFFQGSFFKKPEIIAGKKLTANAAAKFRLLQEINKSDCEIKDLADIVSTDPALSYRLLKFINSAAFSLPNKIQSIQQAVTLLGLQQFRQWALVVVLSDMDSKPKSEVLSYISLQRAHFLERITEVMDKPPYAKDTMFMLGLFSKLDALLDQEMEFVLEGMCLEDEIVEALCGKMNHARDLLELLEGIEQGDWDGVNGRLEDFGLQKDACAVTYLKASRWAGQILGMSKEK